MGAEIGNKYAEKWTEENVIDFFNSVLDSIDETYVFGNAVSLTLDKFMAEGKIKSKRKTYKNLPGYLEEAFKDNENVLGAIKKVQGRFEAKIIDDALSGKARGQAMAIFYLRNKHGYTDKREQEIDIKSPVPIINKTYVKDE